MCVAGHLCQSRLHNNYTVVTLASNANVLDKGYRVYFDNYYTSSKLLDELLYCSTLACGTVWSNRKGNQLQC